MSSRRRHGGPGPLHRMSALPDLVRRPAGARAPRARRGAGALHVFARSSPTARSPTASIDSVAWSPRGAAQARRRRQRDAAHRATSALMLAGTSTFPPARLIGVARAWRAAPRRAEISSSSSTPVGIVTVADHGSGDPYQAALAGTVRRRDRPAVGEAQAIGLASLVAAPSARTHYPGVVSAPRGLACLVHRGAAHSWSVNSSNSSARPSQHRHARLAERRPRLGAGSPPLASPDPRAVPVRGGVGVGPPLFQRHPAGPLRPASLRQSPARARTALFSTRGVARRGIPAPQRPPAWRSLVGFVERRMSRP